MAGGKRRATAALRIVWRGPELRHVVKSGERQRRRRVLKIPSSSIRARKRCSADAVASAGDGKVRLGWDSGDREI